MQKKVATISHGTPLESRIFWLLIVLIAIGAISYMALIQATIMSVVARGEKEESIRSIRSELIALESNYFEKSSTLEISQAASYGLVRFEEEKTVYLARHSDSNLTLGSNAR